MYRLRNQSGKYLQPSGAFGAYETAQTFSRYVDAFNARPFGCVVIG